MTIMWRRASYSCLRFKTLNAAAVSSCYCRRSAPTSTSPSRSLFARYLSTAIAADGTAEKNSENVMPIASAHQQQQQQLESRPEIHGTGVPESLDSLQEESGIHVSGDGGAGVEGVEQVYVVDMEKLQNVLSLLQGSVDGSLESSLHAMDLDLHQEFLIKVLETPPVLGDNLIRFFKWAIKRPGVSMTSPIVDALVQTICSNLRKKDAYGLWDLIQEIADKDNKAVLNEEILNQLIALFSRLGKGKAALEVFNKFGDFMCVPDSDTYYYAVEGLCRRSFYDWAWPVCEKMLHAGALPDGDKAGQIISWLCKGRQAENAHAVYMLGKQKNKYPPRSTLNFLIGSLCQKDETLSLALEILDDFSGEARKYAVKPFSSVIRGLCRIQKVDEAKKLLYKMITEGPPPGNAVFNSVISGYAKSGDMKEAMEILKLMETRGLKPDVYSYTLIMSGYASGGQMEEAEKILLEAKKKHSKLSLVTYHTLIQGYCKLEQFDKALLLFEEMKEFGVQPQEKEYNKLIHSLCLKGLDWVKAEVLLKQMRESGLCVSRITRGLIRAVKEMEEEDQNIKA